jgi:hypothetical protein
MNKLMIDGQQSVEKNSKLLLLVDMDKVDKIVLGMKGVGKYDEYETAEVKKENHREFKRFDKNDNFLLYFLMDFFANMHNPTRYKLFIVPESKAVELAKEIQIIINNPYKEGGLLLKKYELQSEHLQKQLLSEQEKLQTPMKSSGRKI